MNEMLNEHGLELKDGITGGDIVTVLLKSGVDRSLNSSIFKVISCNSMNAVVEFLRNDGPFKAGDRTMLTISDYRWFEASELYKALEGRD